MMFCATIIIGSRQHLSSSSDSDFEEKPIPKVAYIAISSDEDSKVQEVCTLKY